MPMKRLLTILAAAALPGILSAAAQEAALPSPDARALAMGGVQMSSAAGSHTLYGNSAAALFAGSPSQISSSYYGRGTSDYYAVTGYCRFGQSNLAQAGWRQYLRGRGDSDMAVDLGYARRIGERWSVGVVGRYTRFRRPGETADALAADLSVFYNLPLEEVGNYSTLSVGGRLHNLGGCFGATGRRLPMSLTAGAALSTFLSDAHQITVGTDLGYGFAPAAARGFGFSAGAEYNLMQLFQVRAGYHYGERPRFDPGYASVGAGVRFLHLRLDFAYLFFERRAALRDSYSLSFGLDF